MKSSVRLAYLVSHPIQYQAPLLRRIAREPDIDLTVLFGSDFSARGYKDPGFGVDVAWDVPLMAGYFSILLPSFRDNGTVSATRPWSRGVFRALRDKAGKPAFDALWVHGYASVSALQGILAASLLGIPVLLRAEGWAGDRPRGQTKRLLKHGFFRLLRPFITATLPIGSRNEAYWQESLGADIPQFAMPYAVDNEFFARRERDAQTDLPRLRAELQLHEERPVVLFASKLQERKHADHLIEAVHLLSTSQTSRTIHPYLLVVGDGEERKRLEQLTAKLGLTSAVRFLGFKNQSQLPALFALADVFVLPSRHEPWGLIVNEAMASGCAVIVSSDVGAASDLITDGLNGFVTPVGDVSALAVALAKVLSSAETVRRMGEASRIRIATWDFDADLNGLRHALAYSTGKLQP